MKSTLTSFFKTLLGLQLPARIKAEIGDSQPVNAGVRLGRLPFFLAHTVAYALAYLFIQILQDQIIAPDGTPYTFGQFGLSGTILILSLVLMPVYVRRAHDIGWSLRQVALFSILPAFLRLLCLLVPFVVFLNPNAIPALITVMPYIGIAYWVLSRVQLAFFVVLLFAPATGTPNRYGTHEAVSFTFENLYGFRIWQSEKNKKSHEKKESHAHTHTIHPSH